MQAKQHPSDFLGRSTSVVPAEQIPSPPGVYPSAYLRMAATRPPLVRLRVCPPRTQGAGGGNLPLYCISPYPRLTASVHLVMSGRDIGEHNMLT